MYVTQFLYYCRMSNPLIHIRDLLSDRALKRSARTLKCGSTTCEAYCKQESTTVHNDDFISLLDDGRLRVCTVQPVDDPFIPTTEAMIYTDRLPAMHSETSVAVHSYALVYGEAAREAAYEWSSTLRHN